MDESPRAYLNESKDAPAIVGIILVTCITSIIVLGRLASRAFLIRRFGLDDSLTLVSWVCLVVFVGLCIKLIQLGSRRQRHFAYIYTVALLFCRMSGLAFYHRLCAVHDRLRLSIKIVLGVLIAGFLPQVFLIIFHCTPVTGLWPYEWQPDFDKYTCLQWGLVYSVNSSVSLVCDLLLFGIPIVMLRVLEMPRKRKIQLGCILLPGISVIAISITRLVFVIEGQWNADMSWAYNPMLAIEVSEIGATLITLSVLGIKPLFNKFIL
ncbi:hypothetical protein H9Q72_011775 [Fusarium xylarioides]|uniref:Rhodopsin domain-containing protein n=1 Tax=Fusarium xylarioides TaxID=221167 RepID=A0A9P7HN87_9HYPO|nr:hypothetical protein H9Q70_013986 [Fusarium xylarioides]KAG5760120.1 hypothetical protein H9Q72_011775 [Fusarium xylarioides]KAG5769427.1 hypothetical protein H9Q73_013566 [Fusarium xylarioides]